MGYALLIAFIDTILPDTSLVVLRLILPLVLPDAARSSAYSTAECCLQFCLQLLLTVLPDTAVILPDAA
jgi:hypothetical protein